MSRRFACLLVLFLIFGPFNFGGAQTSAARSQTPNVNTRRLIPEANLPCTSEEASWWATLRQAGQAVFSSRGAEEQKKKFADLLEEGRSKSYQPPISDHGIVVLAQTVPGYTEAARRSGINGHITLRVELLSDGTVGPVDIVQGLGFGLDENAEAAARQLVFLPAVKDRQFVKNEKLIHMTFELR